MPKEPGEPKEEEPQVENKESIDFKEYIEQLDPENFSSALRLCAKEIDKLEKLKKQYEEAEFEKGFKAYYASHLNIWMEKEAMLEDELERRKKQGEK